MGSPRRSACRRCGSYGSAGLPLYMAFVLVQTVRAEWRRWHALRLAPWRQSAAAMPSNN